MKVEDEVAQNLINWNYMQHGVRTSSLLLAQMDCPRQAIQKSSRGNQSDKERLVCSTYNKCTTKGKCDYEVAHPDKTCQRRHECGWCRTNLSQSYKHQAWECNKRKEAEGSSPSWLNSPGQSQHTDPGHSLVSKENSRTLHLPIYLNDTVTLPDPELLLFSPCSPNKSSACTSLQSSTIGLMQEPTVKPWLRMSDLQSNVFVLPSNKVFVDKVLPSPVVPIEQSNEYGPDYFVNLHHRVNTPSPLWVINRQGHHRLNSLIYASLLRHWKDTFQSCRGLRFQIQ